MTETTGGAMRPPSASFTWDRPAPPEWVAEWRTHDPIHGEHAAYSVPVWVAGVPEYPIQRWMLYELHPLDATHPDFIAALRGPDVRDAYAKGEITMVSPTQQALYRATGRFGKPWWVVQGARGGHPIQLRPWERKLMRLQGKRDAAPVPGALPYAPLDGRVIQAITARHRWVLEAEALDQSRQRWGVKDAEGERRVREGVVRYLDEQITGEMGREITRSLDTLGTALPVAAHDYAKAEDTAREQYLTV